MWEWFGEGVLVARKSRLSVRQLENWLFGFKDVYDYHK
jgi:hypothetical protein